MGLRVFRCTCYSPQWRECIASKNGLYYEAMKCRNCDAIRWDRCLL